MDYERERRMAEKRAKDALAEKDWRMAGYYLSMPRDDVAHGGDAEGRTRSSLIRLAERYKTRGDQAIARRQPAGQAKVRARARRGGRR